MDAATRQLDSGTPFHPGERAVQRRLGVRERIEPFARQVVRPYMPEEHRLFYGRLPFLVAAARDAHGRPWATLLAGAPGFVSSPTPTRLSVGAAPAPGDALHGALTPGADLGLLGIEFATRRRNRVNGRVVDGEGTLEFAVDQSFGNCPQYIPVRDWVPAPDANSPHARRSHRLSAEAQRWIAGADSFFIASGHRGDEDAAYFGMDASHRGGEPGFVQVDDERTLIFPDYAGNNHFNTIGNLLEDPRVGLLFVDFDGGHLLQLSGRSSIDWESPAVAAIPGARRLVTVRVEAVVELRDALPIRWRASGKALRALEVVEKVRESADVTSFVLAAQDGGSVPDFEAGQHLPVELDIDGARVSRSYSLSAAPDGKRYRVTVKREPRGLVSRTLHDTIEPGDVIAAGAPAGEFHLEPGSRPVVLLSAGVGVTPMASMLASLTGQRDPRNVYFVHGARDGAHHPLAEEVRARASASERVRVHVAYSRPRAEDVVGYHYHSVGRISLPLLRTLLDDQLDADYYLCGPVAFVAELSTALASAGVRPEQVRSETFGPAG